MIVLKSRRELEFMREASRIVAQVLQVVSAEVAPGVTTEALDRLAESEVAKLGAKPAFKGYGGFPFSLCCSVNEQVVHGMPSRRILRQGDIISIDFGAVVSGFYGDAAVTLPVGEVSEAASALIRTTRDSLFQAVDAARVGGRLSDISHAVQRHVEARGYSIVRDYVGHGIGAALHEDPQLPNFGPAGKGPVLKAGMVFAIEPMVNQKGYQVEVLQDGWTVVTADGGLSAHFEHTVAVTEDGPEILTQL